MANPDQQHLPGQNPSPKTPTGGDRAPIRQDQTADVNPAPAKPGSRRDDLANSANSESVQADGQTNQQPDEPRRYDEADPNWTHENVQMNNQAAPEDKDTLM